MSVLNPTALGVWCFLLLPPVRAEEPDANWFHRNDVLIGPLFGPQKSEVTIRHERKPVELLLLTENRVAYRELNAKRTLVVDPPIGARSPSVTTVTIHQIKEPRQSALIGAWAYSAVRVESIKSWQRDARGKFVGPALAPIAIDLTPRAMSDREIETYMIVRAIFLTNALDEKVLQQNETEVVRTLKYAEELRKFAVEKEWRAVAALYDLAPYADAQREIVKKIITIIQQSTARKLTAQQWEQANRTQANNIVRSSNAKLLTGAALLLFAEDNERMKDIGARVAVDGLSDYDRLEALRKEADAERHRLAAIDQADAMRCEDLWKLYEKQRAERQSLFEGLTPLQLASGADLRKSDKTESILKLDRHRSFHARDGHTHPFLTSELAGLLIPQIEAGAVENIAHLARFERGMAMARPSVKSQLIYQLGLDVAESVRAIPPDALFDRDRVDIIHKSAEIIHTAIVANHGKTRWSNCFDPRADYALRILQHAKRYDKERRKTAELDALQAWLCLQRGLIEDAVRFGDSAAALRKWDPVTQFNLVRVYGAYRREMAGPENKPVRDAMKAKGVEALKNAIRSGHFHTRLAREDSDAGEIVNLKDASTLDKEVEALLTPKVEATIIGKQIIISNHSDFPLIQSTLTFRQGNRSAAATINEEIAAHGVFIIENTLNAQFGRGTLTIASPFFSNKNKRPVVVLKKPSDFNLYSSSYRLFHP